MKKTTMMVVAVLAAVAAFAGVDSAALLKEGIELQKAKKYAEAMEKLIAATEASAKTPRVLPKECDQAMADLTKRKEYAAVDKFCARILAIPEIAPASKVKVCHRQIGNLAAQGKRAEAVAMADKMLADKVNPVETAMVGAEAAKGLGQGFEETLKYYEKVIGKHEAYGIEGKELRRLISEYAFMACRAMDRKRLENAESLFAKYGLEPSWPWISGSVLKQYRALDSFPKDEKDIKFPTDLTDFGVNPNRKIVHAKDFGWNPTNATECLQNAFDSDASTVIVDDMGSPWYIWTVDFSKGKSSNKKIVFKKGVVVLTAPEHKDKTRPGWFRKNMFNFNGVTNLFITGEGDIKDVYIGKYHSRKERYAAGFQYGGCGFGGHCRNVVLKNLWIANCGQDALCWGGYDSYVIDCIFDDNFRQGLSVTSSENCYYKNVTFCNTVGGEPHNGIDFEPSYESYSCPFHYFFDCKFYNNAAGNMIFAISTFAPVAAYFKRCEFEPHRYRNISIYARLGIYVNALAHAPSKIVFDECRIDGYSDGAILQFNSLVFDMLFKKCTFNDRGQLDRSRKPNRSPILLNLDRPFWDGFYPKAGVVTFENCKVNGYEGKPLVQVADRNGKLGINTFRGKIDHNGKKVDMSKFSYLPPEAKFAECAEPELAKLDTAVRRADVFTPGFDFTFGRSWYHPMPRFKLLAKGANGQKATFKILWTGKIDSDAKFRVQTPSGKTVDIAAAQTGTNVFEYAFQETGVHSFDANWARDEDAQGFQVLETRGVSLAYNADLDSLGRLVQLKTDKAAKKYVGYFEVPGGKTCNFKLTQGGIEIRDENGKSIIRKESDAYVGTTCFSFKPAKPAIWSFSVLEERIGLKFYDPLTGIWSDDPETLPTTKPGLKFARVEDVAEMPELLAADANVKLPDKYVKIVEELAAKRLAKAKAGKAAAMYETAVTELDKFKKTVTSDGAAHEVEDMTARVNRLKLHADAERAAQTETEEMRKMAAFCEAYVMEYAPEMFSGTRCSMEDGVFNYTDEVGLKRLYGIILSRLPR